MAAVGKSPPTASFFPKKPVALGTEIDIFRFRFETAGGLS
jgi:hypothetical protein